MKQVTGEFQITIKMTFKMLLSSESNTPTLKEQVEELTLEMPLRRLSQSWATFMEGQCKYSALYTHVQKLKKLLILKTAYLKCPIMGICSQCHKKVNSIIEMKSTYWVQLYHFPQEETGPREAKSQAQAHNFN